MKYKTFLETKKIQIQECTCVIESWRTENVFLTKEEAMNHGKSRPYAWGEYEEGWRICLPYYRAVLQTRCCICGGANF